MAALFFSFSDCLFPPEPAGPFHRETDGVCPFRGVSSAAGRHGRLGGCHADGSARCLRPPWVDRRLVQIAKPLDGATGHMQGGNELAELSWVPSRQAGLPATPLLSVLLESDSALQMFMGQGASTHSFELFDVGQCRPHHSGLLITGAILAHVEQHSASSNFSECPGEWSPAP